MRWNAQHSDWLGASPRWAAVLAGGLAAFAVWLCGDAGRSAASVPAGSHQRFVCSKPNSASIPCHFSTPSGNVRCVWMPKPNNVACVVVATGRAYRLRPTGHVKSIRLTLRSRGEPLPTNQQLLFPDSLSCHDTRTTMTCNQDFGLGTFTLPLRARTAH